MMVHSHHPDKREADQDGKYEGHCFSNWSPSGPPRVLGILISKISSVIAMAKTPSENASTRPSRYPRRISRRHAVDVQSGKSIFGQLLCSHFGVAGFALFWREIASAPLHLVAIQFLPVIGLESSRCVPALAFEVFSKLGVLVRTPKLLQVLCGTEGGIHGNCSEVCDS